MTPIDELLRAEQIVRQVCDEAQDALIERVRQAVEASCPRVKVLTPKRPYAYAARSGPKELDRYKLSPDILESRVVLPVGNLEIKRSV
jgi:hypothetical protein